MSQLPDEIYVRQESKYGTLDFVTAYLYPWAFEEEGYKMEDMQMYIPSYRLQEFAERVRKMREAQAEQEVISERLMYIRQHKGVLTDKDFLDVTLITDKVVDLEDKVDEYLKEMEEEK